MALVCDYCGDVTASCERVQVAFGHNQEIALKGATAQEWFFYCEGECADKVRAMLDNLRLFAMHGEGSGLVWELTQQEVAPVGQAPVPARPPEPEPESPEPELPRGEKGMESERWKRRSENRHIARPLAEWLPEDVAEEHDGALIGKFVPHTSSVAKLRSTGLVTLADVATLTRVEVQGCYGVGANVLRQIETALQQEGMAFQPGPSAEQLGEYLRRLWEGKRLTLAECAVLIAEDLGIPGEYERLMGWEHGEDKYERGCEPLAHHELRSRLQAAGLAKKPLPPSLLDAIAKVFELPARNVLLDAAANAKVQP